MARKGTRLAALSQPSWATYEQRKKLRKKTFKRGRRGRPKGSLNKIDQQALTADWLRSIDGKLSIVHMAELLEHLRLLVTALRPYTFYVDEKTGEVTATAREGGNWKRYLEAVRMFIALSGALAPYQSPRLAAIKVEGGDRSKHRHRLLHADLPVEEIARYYEEAIKPIEHVIGGDEDGVGQAQPGRRHDPAEGQ
jgi:hypothetical protein